MYGTSSLTHFIRDTPEAVSDIFGNIFLNIEKYLTESCPEGPNNQCFLNLFIQSWAGFNKEANPRWDEPIQEKLSMKCVKLTK